MKERAALAVLLPAATLAALLLVLAAWSLRWYLDREDTQWAEQVHRDRSSPDELSPAQLAELHEEARNITREAQ